jgi:chemotaxis protein MotB
LAKKQPCPEFENHERWLVAFADMMTLLFALFVVLYSLANIEMEKLKKASTSIQKAFGMITEHPDAKEGVTPKGNSRADGIFDRVKGNTNRESFLKFLRKEQAALISAESQKIEQILEDRLYGSKDFSSAKKEGNPDQVIFVNRDTDGIRISLLARKFFKSSRSELNEEAKVPLDAVAQIIKEMGRRVRVEGHTDALPFQMNGQTNWELSATRATAVVRYIIEKHKMDRELIYAAGFADTIPVAANDSPENRSLNRRVDIKILYDNPGEYLGEKPPPEFDSKEDSH